MLKQIFSGLYALTSIPVITAIALSAPPRPKIVTLQPTSVASYTRIRKFVDTYCVSCHGSTGAQAGINLTKDRSMATIVANRQVWDKVHLTVSAQSMPPKSMPGPESVLRGSFVSTLQAAFSEVDCKLNDPGRVTIRRLNRVEYNNTVRDLLGVRLTPADSFPSDDVGYGFDNIGDVLSISPLLMEKFLAAAATLAKAAVSAPEDTAFVVQIAASKLENRDNTVSSAVGTKRSFGNNSMAGFTFTALRSGVHKLTVVAGGDQFGGEPVRMRIMFNGVMLADVDVPNAAETPMPYTIPLDIRSPGLVNVGIGFINDKFGGVGKDRNLLVHSLEVAAPRSVGVEQTAIVRVRPVDASLSAWDTAMSANLRPLMRRAFRRAVTKGEVDRLVRLTRTAHTHAMSFEKGLQLALQVILVSPNFLYKLEVDPDANNAKVTRSLNGFELATRLSYFFWSSMPDDVLLNAAASGKLVTKEQIKVQVTRMIRDPKSIALSQNFAGQWLGLRKASIVQPDVVRFPKFNEGLRQAMQLETELWFDYIVRSDRPVMELINADYTFLNEQLADFYAVPNVVGSQMRRVILQGGQRGGILGQASVLMLTSNPRRTSPVKRGKWVLENLLGTPPPPPPPNVPSLPEERGGGVAVATTVRARLEEHRKNPACASCHERLDGMGFALENFDAVGGWRLMDGATTLDVTGVLQDGSKINGFAGLQKYLMSRKSEVIRSMLDRLMTYAIGRGIERYDQCDLDKMTASVISKGGTFSRLVDAVIASKAFRSRRGDGAMRKETQSIPKADLKGKIHVTNIK